jgi:uncharacterized protein DUF4169
MGAFSAEAWCVNGVLWRKPRSDTGYVGSGMGDVIKLRGARKLAERRLKDERAAANRLLYGCSKGERNLKTARDAKAHRDLDQHRVERGDDR